MHIEPFALLPQPKYATFFGDTRAVYSVNRAGYTTVVKGRLLVINSELFQFPPERNTVDSEHLRGLGTITVSHLENTDDMFGFLLFECRWWSRDFRCKDTDSQCSETVGQVFDAEFRSGRQRHTALDKVG